jgi:aromatic ring-cleaving dioxygenase
MSLVFNGIYSFHSDVFKEYSDNNLRRKIIGRRKVFLKRNRDKTIYPHEDSDNVPAEFVKKMSHDQTLVLIATVEFRDDIDIS